MILKYITYNKKMKEVFMKKSNEIIKWGLKTGVCLFVTFVMLLDFSLLNAQTVNGLVFGDANLNFKYDSGKKVSPM
jgi:hypothetical protein